MIFYMEGCPYCRNARKAVDDLLEADPSYAELKVRWIEENRERKLADSYDYYHVPSVFLDGQKLYEASPGDDYAKIRGHMKEALDLARAGQA